MQNLVERPLETIDAWFLEAYLKTPGQIPVDWGEKDKLLNMVENMDLPSLNETPCVENLPLRSLVRYRGMVQEVCEREMFSAALDGARNVVNMKYKDLADVAIQGENPHFTPTTLCERNVYYCVPVPGETWAREDLTPIAEPTDMSRPKRPRDEDDTMEVANKAPKASDDLEAITNSGVCLPDFNLPLPWEADGKRTRCAVVKTYDNDGQDLRVMDIVEVIAIIHMDWIEYPEEWKTGCRTISCGLAPRLHAISVKRREYYNPVREIPDMSMKVIRESLIEHLRSLVCGDRLAASYALLALIQREFKRADDIPYGRLTLGLQLGVDQAGVFSEGVRALMPQVAVLPVSIETLSESQWVPKKNYEKDTFASGLLQLAPGTLVIFDENTLAEGKLMETGLKNLCAIKQYLIYGVVQADFEFYPVSLPTRHSNIVLSSGKQPILEPELVCPVDSSPDQLALTCDEDTLMIFRSYIAQCLPVAGAPMRFESALAEKLPQDFANMRQQDNNISQSMCNVWTSLVRLNAITHGDTEVKLHHWTEILDMEKTRMKRF